MGEEGVDSKCILLYYTGTEILFHRYVDRYETLKFATCCTMVRI